MDKTDIEEDIKIIKQIKRTNLALGFEEQTRTLQAIENILADRERKIENIQSLQEALDKSDANNVKLELEVKKYKNMYEAEHRIHLVRNEQLERKEIAVQKVNQLENENKKQKEDIQRLQELLDLSDAKSIEYQKEIEALKNDTYWKGYIDKQNQAVEVCKMCKYKGKANKYDSLVHKLEKDIDKADSIINDEEYRYIQEVLDEQYERKKYAQEILEIVKGEKK